jgi:hypothetical protein
VRDDNDTFDLANLRLTAEASAAMDRATAAKQTQSQPKRQRQQFVMVPWWWVERLTHARHMAAYRLALFVLYQHWKTKKPVVASNRALKPMDVPRRSKYRAIRELERLGLIRAEARPRRSPLITVATKS